MAVLVHFFWEQTLLYCINQYTFKLQTAVCNSVPPGSAPASFKLSIVNMNDTDLPEPTPFDQSSECANDDKDWDDHVRKVIHN